MTREDRGHYGKKHPPERQVRPELAEGVKRKSSEGGLPCVSAFELVDEQMVPPEEVGFTADSLEIAIVRCQLGLFGYRPKKKVVVPAKNVSPELKGAIERGLVDGRLPCAESWKIAARSGLKKMEVSSACEALKIKIAPCQLGAF